MFGKMFEWANLSRVRGILAIVNGGTGASTAAGARTNLDIYSKSETDALVVGLYDDRGNYDASGNAFPSSGGSGSAGAILKGDIWLISVAGTLGTKAVEVGDTVRALTDSPGQTASNWATMQANYGDTITNTIFRPKTVEESLSGTRALTRTEGQTFNLNPNGSARDVTLWSSPTVGDTVKIRNSGNAGNALTIKDSGGTAISGAIISNGVTMTLTYYTGGWSI